MTFCRMCKHLIVKSNNDSVIKEHHSFCYHSHGFDDLSISVSNHNEVKVTLRESFCLKKNWQSLPSEFF